MTEKLRTEKNDIDILIDAFISVSDKKELRNFLDDLLTIKELEELGHRFTVARMLDEGRIYTDIQKVTGASSATISRVNRALTYGADGYKAAIKHLNNQ